MFLSWKGATERNCHIESWNSTEQRDVLLRLQTGIVVYQGLQWSCSYLRGEFNNQELKVERVQLHHLAPNVILSIGDEISMSVDALFDWNRHNYSKSTALALILDLFQAWCSVCCLHFTVKFNGTYRFEKPITMKYFRLLRGFGPFHKQTINQVATYRQPNQIHDASNFELQSYWFPDPQNQSTFLLFY